MDLLAILGLGLCALAPGTGVLQLDESADAGSRAWTRIAQAPGCCKKWEPRTGSWRIIEVDHAQCEELNRRHDKDDVSSQQGKIWWDAECRR